VLLSAPRCKAQAKEQPTQDRFEPACIRYWIPKIVIFLAAGDEPMSFLFEGGL